MELNKQSSLDQIDDAMNATRNLLQNPDLSLSGRSLLENCQVQLDSLRESIVSASAQALIDALSSKTAELDKMADEMNKEAGNLSAISDKIQKISNAVGTLVSVTAAAVSARIL